jgi:hypothetical protein
VVSFTLVSLHPGEQHPVHTGEEAEWAPEPYVYYGEEKNLACNRYQTQTIQHIAHHYTDWAISAPQIMIKRSLYLITKLLLVTISTKSKSHLNTIQTQ